MATWDELKEEYRKRGLLGLLPRAARAAAKLPLPIPGVGPFAPSYESLSKIPRVLYGEAGYTGAPKDLSEDDMAAQRAENRRVARQSVLAATPAAEPVRPALRVMGTTQFAGSSPAENAYQAGRASRVIPFTSVEQPPMPTYEEMAGATPRAVTPVAARQSVVAPTTPVSDFERTQAGRNALHEAMYKQGMIKDSAMVGDILSREKYRRQSEQAGLDRASQLALAQEQARGMIGKATAEREGQADVANIQAGAVLGSAEQRSAAELGTAKSRSDYETAQANAMLEAKRVEVIGRLKEAVIKGAADVKVANIANSNLFDLKPMPNGEGAYYINKSTGEKGMIDRDPTGKFVTTDFSSGGGMDSVGTAGEAVDANRNGIPDKAEAGMSAPDLQAWNALQLEVKRSGDIRNTRPSIQASWKKLSELYPFLLLPAKTK